MKKEVIVFGILLGGGIFVSKHAEEFPRKPLLRVFPAYRSEECLDWAIRPFVCQKCLKKGMRYAQKIECNEETPYRSHGCYTEEGGFVPEEESSTF